MEYFSTTEHVIRSVSSEGMILEYILVAEGTEYVRLRIILLLDVRDTLWTRCCYRSMMAHISSKRDHTVKTVSIEMDKRGAQKRVRYQVFLEKPSQNIPFARNDSRIRNHRVRHNFCSEREFNRPFHEMIHIQTGMYG